MFSRFVIILFAFNGIPSANGADYTFNWSLEQPQDGGVCPTNLIVHEELEKRTTLLVWDRQIEAEGGPPSFDEPLVSDRPDFTEASTTVGLGVRQLEMGYTFLTDDDGTARLTAHSLPELLFRWGVFAEWLELRIGWSFDTEHLAFVPLTRTTSGSDDIYLGLKLGLTLQQGIWPEMAIVPQTTVPVGGIHSANRVLPGINWLYGWDINDFLSTAGSTQLNLAIDDNPDNEFVELAQSWTIGYSLSERVGAYTEWFAFFPVGADTAGAEHYGNGGFTFRWSNDLQFDVRDGLGLSRNASDFFTGGGAVVRW